MLRSIIKLVCVCIAVCVSLMFTSCSLFMPSRGYFDGGEILDKEKMSEIKSRFFTEEITSEIEESSSGTEKEESPKKETVEVTSVDSTENTENLSDSESVITDITEETTTDSITQYESESTLTSDIERETEHFSVYWTESGEVWHLTQSCRYLKNSKTIISGSIENARSFGKTKACSSCSKN